MGVGGISEMSAASLRREVAERQRVLSSVSDYKADCSKIGLLLIYPAWSCRSECWAYCGGCPLCDGPQRFHN